VTTLVTDSDGDEHEVRYQGYSEYRTNRDRVGVDDAHPLAAA